MNVPSYDTLMSKDKLIKVIRELCELVDKLQKTQPKKMSDLDNDSGFVTQDSIVTGDVIVVANQEMPSEWLDAENMGQLIQKINNDNKAIKGTSFLSTMSLSDLPAGMRQAEIKAEVLLASEMGKVILFTVTSEDTAPYHWEYTSAYGRTNVWRSF